jgi:hypothetical protein
MLHLEYLPAFVHATSTTDKHQCFHCQLAQAVINPYLTSMNAYLELVLATAGMQQLDQHAQSWSVYLQLQPSLRGHKLSIF